MKKQKGFISTSIIYSFFLVFILIMIAFLMSFINKRFLISKINDSFENDDVSLCQGDTLSDCLFKRQNIEEGFDEKNVEDIQQRIVKKGTPDFTVAAIDELGMFAAEDDYTQRDEEGEIKNNTMSYYYRGAEDDNYVVFADQVWQIIRVNGDGSIRMIYKGQYNSAANKDEAKFKAPDHIVFELDDIIKDKNIEGDYNDTYNKFHFAFNDASKRKITANAFMNQLYKPFVGGECTGKSLFGNIGNRFCEKIVENIDQNYYKTIFDVIHTSSSNVGAYFAHNIGFMVNDNSSSNYDERFQNSQDSVIKFMLDVFYSYIFDSDEEEYLSDGTIFCGDKDILSLKAATGDDLDIYKYRGTDRYINKNPSLKCANSGTASVCASEAVLNLSRYNVQSDECSTYDCQKKHSYYLGYGGKCNIWGLQDCEDVHKSCNTLGNGALDNPIGIISMDELFYAGATKDEDSNTYLKSNTQFWTMTPSFTSLLGVKVNGIGARYFALDQKGKIIELNDTSDSGVATIRPVINLHKDVLYCDGKGTAKDPYIIGNGSCS